jgi:benzoyl-CoA reductase/2-hydroxyglutaryl-CoA dehydratase subunit BcrC/BadD/HgdB
VTAIEQLTWHYEHPYAQARMPVAGMTSNTVPWEILHAAGYFPVMLKPEPGPSPFADQFMEQGVFSTRIRGIFDGLASNAWPFLKLVVIPRTSEQEHKLFLYLRELARQEIVTGMPELYLYNLLRTRSPEAEQYGLERTRDLANHLNANDLAHAVEESNQAYRAVSKLLALREGPEPGLSGTEALALIGAMYFMDRTEYAQLANQAVGELSRRKPLSGPRILIKGNPGLHQTIESHGAIVVAEDDWRGIPKEIPTGGDLIQAIFETYYRGAGSQPAVPSFTTASAPDAVIFHLPPEDDVLGWDYPRQSQSLDQQGIPNLRVRDKASEALPAFIRKLHQ